MSGQPPTHLLDLVPDAEALLLLQPEEIGELLMEVIHAGPGWGGGGLTAAHAATAANRYPPPHREALREAIVEAWSEGPGVGSGTVARVLATSPHRGAHHGRADPSRPSIPSHDGADHPVCPICLVLQLSASYVAPPAVPVAAPTVIVARFIGWTVAAPPAPLRRSRFRARAPPGRA